MSKCWSRLLLAASWMCLQTATLSDGNKPRIECPPPQVKYITMNTDTIVEIFDKSNVNVSDNSRLGSSVMFDPPSIVLDRTSINHVQQIEATTTDASGNNNTCRFEYLIKAAPCSPLSLETPLHGSKSCAAKFGGSGFTCSISCDTGYVFYDLSTSKTSISTLHLPCDTGVPWSVNIPACADASK
ncbi:sushi repeat-containing protein SRPX2-like [Gigantopelta aegis]|uniref:sushi repeat-containing protein SRPX2-like n=1 Tax=Gigantopelta aegis TaxID=1735272 RepID=UPI001B88DE7A|nr:sushi repeat-containing protein SRPX2-like [Gigantopelta aegis]